MTELEKVIANELRRIDPQESGVETKAKYLATRILDWFSEELDDSTPDTNDTNDTVIPLFR